MTALPGHRVRQAGAFVALALACAVASAETPTDDLGKPVQEITLTVRGTPIVLHATDGGFIPESTDRFTFDVAGPQMHKATADTPPRYQWNFGFTPKGDAKPVRVRIEDIDTDADILVVDDTAPSIANGRWAGRATSQCDIVRESACAKWVFAKGVQSFIFRMTVAFDDDTTQVLYQGAAFNPDTMQPIWSFLGVKR